MPNNSNWVQVNFIIYNIDPVNIVFQEQLGHL